MDNKFVNRLDGRYRGTGHSSAIEVYPDAFSTFMSNVEHIQSHWEMEMRRTKLVVMNPKTNNLLHGLMAENTRHYSAIPPKGINQTVIHSPYGKLEILLSEVLDVGWWFLL